MKPNTKQNVCRACLAEEGSFKSVFVKESSSGLSMNISEMLTACATIQVHEGDGLPDQICSECSKQTVKMFLFKLRCEQSDIILRTNLKKSKANSVEIKNESDDIVINKNFINEDIKNNNFRCKIDEKEMWEALKEESIIKEFKSEFCQETVNQIDLLTGQKIVEEKKIEKLEIIDKNIEIKYNSFSPLLMENKESSFTFSECDLVFVKKENLKKHINDIPIKKEPEMSCDEILKRKQQLVEISLLENNPYGCDICFKGFDQISELEEHLKTHTSTSKQTGEQPCISNVVSDKEFHKSYECDICRKKFTYSSNLKQHRRTHTGEKPFQCEKCNRKFKGSYSLTVHKRIHTGEKPYECDLCKKKFSQSNTLVRHKRVHTGEKPYECEVCKKRFKQLVHLTTHKRIHSDQKPYECEVCKKRFSQSVYLKIHKRIHTGEKPYECDFCKRKFPQSSRLSIHKRIHTGAKPYKCDVCRKKFSQKNALVAHKKVHTGEKPFECDICQMKFSHAGNLKKHKTTHKI